MVVRDSLGALFVWAVLTVTACNEDGGDGGGSDGGEDDCATNRCEAGGVSGGGSGGATGSIAGTSGASGKAGAGSGGKAGSGASGAGGTTGGNGGNAAGGAQPGGSGGSSSVAGSGAATCGVGGGGGDVGGGGGAGGLAVDPPLCALEGLWHQFRESPKGTCGVEPTTWTPSGRYFRLAWNGRSLATYYCSDAVTCDTFPNGFEEYYPRDGQWRALYQPLPANGLCTIDIVRLRLFPDGVLRKIRTHNEIDEASCSMPASAYACVTEYLQESQRAP